MESHSEEWDSSVTVYSSPHWQFSLETISNRASFRQQSHDLPPLVPNLSLFQERHVFRFIVLKASICVSEDLREKGKLTKAVGETANRIAAALLLGRSAGDTVKRVWREAAVSIGGL